MVIREVLMSFRQSFTDDPIACLESYGLSRDHAAALSRELCENGSLLDQLGVDKGITELLKSVHTDSWFVRGDSDNAIVTNRGGRQGCKLGSIVFSLIYSKALKKLRDKLLKHGVLLHLPLSDNRPFWCDPGVSDTSSDECVAEATFVDDEAVLLCAKSPGALKTAIGKLLYELVDIFNESGFVINWATGKTEAILTFRGKRARQATADLFKHGEGNNRLIPIPHPSCPGKFLTIVSDYKHVGTTVSYDGNFVPDSRIRVRATMTGYVPLAKKVFGSILVPRSLKLELAASLMFSRLFYGTQLWVASRAEKAIRNLNSTYMRILRRILDDPRFSAQCTYSDVEVRRVLNMPSVDSRLRQRRLCYAARLARHGPKSLLALLQCRVGPNHSRMPWAQQLLDDLRFLKDFHYIKLGSLGDPEVDAEAWSRVMCDFPSEWRELVRSFIEFGSPICDRSTASSHGFDGCSVLHSFRCDRCDTNKRYKSQKALDTHMRVKHQCRTRVEEYVGCTTVCPICNKDFHCRPRLLCHLAETRIRSKYRTETCQSILLSGRYAKIGMSELTKARLSDRSLRREAWRSGKTHVVASKPVYRPRGSNTFTVHCDAAPYVALSNRLKRKTSLAELRPSRRVRRKTDPTRVRFISRGANRSLD